MGCSEAKVAANRRNALRSSGPRTEAGKVRSRGNALKHGMSGDGVVLPVGDGAVVEALEARLAAEMRPVGVVGEEMVRRAAVLLVRLRRCGEHDLAATAHRVRHAVSDHEDQRADDVAALAVRVASEPADAVRRLRRTPEGIEWLIGEWRAIRREVAGAEHAEGGGAGLADRVGALLGLGAGDEPEVEAEVEGEAWQGWCRDLGDGTGNRDRVLARLDREVAGLRILRAEVGPVAAADRAEAPARALLDETPAGQRARKYEAAAERGLFRVLRELREARAEAPFAPLASRSAPDPVPPPTPVRPTPAPAIVASTATPPTPAGPDPLRESVALLMAWPTWPDLPVEERIDVPLSIGRGAIPAKTNPPTLTKTNPTRRRPRLR